MFKKILCNILVLCGANAFVFGQSVELLPPFLTQDFEKESGSASRSRPLPARKSPHAFHLKKGDRIVFLGDGLLEREQWHGHLETRLTIRYPRRGLVFRNLSWSGDTPSGRARASFDWHKEKSFWFENIKQALIRFEPSVILLGYGMSSSFDGIKGLGTFRQDYEQLIDRIEASISKEIRFVLLSPIRHENLGAPLPHPDDHNRWLAAYSSVIRDIAEDRGFPFVNLFEWLGDGLEANIARAHTDNGIHLNAYGYSRLADIYSTTMGCEPFRWELGLGREGTRASRIAGNRVSDVVNLAWKTIFRVRDLNLPFPNRDEAGKAYPSSQRLRRIGFMNLPVGKYLLKIDGQPIMTHPHDRWSLGMALTKGPMFQQAESLRKLIVKKNRLFFHRFRPQNHTYLFGFRRHEQGKHAVEISALDPLIAELEEDIAQLAVPRQHYYELIALMDDEADPAKDFVAPSFEPKASDPSFVEPIIEQSLPEFKLAEGLEISLFARDPLLHKPIQMNFDPQGRLWVATSSVYPQIRPDQNAEDSILILEDRDKNGVAESSTLFADGLLIPTGVAPGNGGAYVAQGTDLLHFEDVDGDGKADKRRVILSGFGTEDTHHLLHTLRWGHDGQLYMNQSIYIHSHIETPHGIERLNSGGIWHLRPDTLELGVFLKGFCNPWGHHFDPFGQSFITDGAGFQGVSFGIPGAMYFTYARAPRLLESISPGNYPKYCGLEIIHSEQFPKKFQGFAITCDFRSHRIVPFKIDEHGAGYVAQEQPEWVRGLSNSFRPVDVKIGPDGALYVADWANPIIQHGEVDFRDPRRDKVHGRIWRITHKAHPLVKTPPLKTASDLDLFEGLLSKNGFEREQSRRVLTERGQSIIKPLRRWIKSKEEDESALLQALWLHQSLDKVAPDLLRRLLEAKDGRVRAAAVRVLRFWRNRIDENHELLTKRIADPHPRVRLEAVRALAFEGNAEDASAILKVLSHPMDRFLDYATWLSIRELSEIWVNALRANIWDPKGREKQLEFGLQSIESERASEVLSRLLQGRSIDEKGHWIELIGKAGSAADLQTLLNKLIKGELNEAASLRAMHALNEAKRLRGTSPKNVTGISTLLDHSDSSLQSAALRFAGLCKLHRFEGHFQNKAANQQTPRPARESAIEALRALGSQSAYGKLSELLIDPDSTTLRPQIARAMASMNLAEAMDPIFEVLDELPHEADLRSIWETMLRQKNAETIVRKALRERTLSRSVATMGMRVARESGRHWSDLILAIEEAGNLATTDAELNRTRIQTLTRQTMIVGDAHRGESIYRRIDLGCVMCHGIGGVGGKVGPDLTSIGASAPLDYLVESLLVPNAKVKEGYQSLIVETKNGEQFSGVLAREDASELFIRNAANQILSIAKQDIVERIEGASLMPTGLIDGLTDLQKADLFRFLSELGKPGRFDATRGNVARLWQLRAAHHTDEQFGIAAILSNHSKNQWQSAMTLVDGHLTRETMQNALGLRTQSTSWIALFAAVELQLPQSETAILRLDAPADSSLWINGEATPFSREKRLTLSAGTHRIVLKLNPWNLPKSIRAQCDEGTFLIRE